MAAKTAISCKVLKFRVSVLLQATVNLGVLKTYSCFVEACLQSHFQGLCFFWEQEEVKVWGQGWLVNTLKALMSSFFSMWKPKICRDLAKFRIMC